ncbi:hypothetical protein TGRUB_261700 [Toxoplasma gondii RUB]|uniref:Uncharacterized protein n=12 Tax=Toxoplasma gondii TaxID=5811 RepID=A0A125YJY6_TOXGV|nr:hypothetical protein TGGT1_261700 [Toxoplasma gondii GT1]ESS31985.1 hypothetical protein TGVEG_261700 [Toxoplasma gondii VEG]KAF4641092.1 hypothetical protein TGRH88_069010 [Toxoplasma gondii]KFG39541.1 hypothetical protein TGP89_261700 [Toxoplasma gondii p89]KFG49437.1 hypothetical protein TGDOM2_261700 [Toxoplasma gondii GAB2-2007-GAL-DOM2]KFG52728.1 hypothetical protein TGFOU_261700 [Toxoplasma gondii FOU]KFG65423.1 hypothetical protein TGRUB_261700 [Toxoplasma gondii RUB]KFH10527.1 hy
MTQLAESRRALVNCWGIPVVLWTAVNLIGPSVSAEYNLRTVAGGHIRERNDRQHNAAQLPRRTEPTPAALPVLAYRDGRRFQRISRHDVVMQSARAKELPNADVTPPVKPGFHPVSPEVQGEIKEAEARQGENRDFRDWDIGSHHDVVQKNEHTLGAKPPNSSLARGLAGAKH